MTSSLSTLVNNFAVVIHEIKCKYGYNDRKRETCGIKKINWDFFLEYTNYNDDLIENKCLCCIKNYQKKFDENFKKRLFNTYKLSKHDINKIVLLLRKDIYPYKYIDDGKNSVKLHYLKNKVLQSSKHGRYYWYRLQACKMSL